MNYRQTALLATFSTSLRDCLLDYTVNQFNYNKILFVVSFISFVIQLLLGFFVGLSCTLNALPYILIHSLLILFGYFSFVQALKHAPIALVTLISSSALFLTLIIDSFIGYISITPYILSMVFLFVFSVVLYSKESLKTAHVSLKKINTYGIVWAFLSMLFYLLTPYLIKKSYECGASAICINLGYYLLAVPCFGFLYFKTKTNNSHQNKQKWWNNFWILCFVVSFLESVYFVFETFSFMHDVPTIIEIIAQMRVFVVFALSVLFGTDRFSFKKIFALMLGSVAVVGVYIL